MIIANGELITPFVRRANTALIVKNGIIEAFLPGSQIEGLDDERIDAEGGYVIPGLLDIHTHGALGSDFMDATFEDFSRILRFQASHGVTTVLATTLTVPVPEIIACMEAARRYMGAWRGGSRLAGIHLEGPYISAVNKGAHLEKYLRVPERDKYDFIFEYSDVVKTVTIAPELPGSPRMIRELTDRGIVVSGGHDGAVDEDVFRAVEAGMTHTTHLFCAMSTISRKDGHKYAGLTEIALADGRLTAELVADGFHVPAPLMQLAYKCKGPDGLCIVSDCLRPAGMKKDGARYVIGPKNGEGVQKVVVDDDVARLPDSSMLAGSILTVDTMLKKLVDTCEIPLQAAVKMASATPAGVIGMDRSIGSLEVGRKADICILDRNLKVQKTIIEGKVVYEHER